MADRARQSQATAGKVRKTSLSRRKAEKKHPPRLKKQAGECVSRKEGPKKRKEGKKGSKPKAWQPCDPLPDGQQEYFCLKMAEGPYSQKSCYMQAYPDSAPDSARANASRLMTNDSIRRRIDHLRKELVKDVKLTVEESIRWCLLVRDTPVGYIDEESPLAQEVIRKEMQMGGPQGQLKRGSADSGNEIEESPAATILETKIKIPSKMDAQKQIDKLMGFDKTDKDPLEKAVDTMADMIRMIREKRGGDAE